MKGRPTQTELFDVIYGIAARDGREEALFGNDILMARPAFERMVIGDAFPHVYFEFPLIGAPGFDLLAGYGYLERGTRFSEGSGYGRQDMFDWLAEICEEGKSASIGFEVDSSSGRTDVAGVYMQQRRSIELVGPFLSSIGEDARTASYDAMCKRLPKGWRPSYVGLFPGRLGTPMRIGGYLSPLAQKRCTEIPGYLQSCFEKVGYAAYSDEMLLRCTRLMELAPSVDYQLDIMPDGSLGDTFGLSLSFNEIKPREAHACFQSGYGAQLMGLLEEWGLADDRWRRIADAAFAQHVGYRRDDGSPGRLALCILLNFAKVKFVSGVSSPAKFYLMGVAKELGER